MELYLAIKAALQSGYCRLVFKKYKNLMTERIKEFS